MPKFKVKIDFTFNDSYEVEAADETEAKEIACEKAWNRIIDWCALDASVENIETTIEDSEYNFEVGVYEKDADGVVVNNLGVLFTIKGSELTGDNKKDMNIVLNKAFEEYKKDSPLKDSKNKLYGVVFAGDKEIWL